MICPCRECPDRHEACHDSCEKYRDWKAPFLRRSAEKVASVGIISTVMERWIRKLMNDRKRRH